MNRHTALVDPDGVGRGGAVGMAPPDTHRGQVLIMPTTKQVMKKYGKCGETTNKRGETVYCHKRHGHDGRHQGKLPPATLGTVVMWEDTDE